MSRFTPWLALLLFVSSSALGWLAWQEHLQLIQVRADDQVQATTVRRDGQRISQIEEKLVAANEARKTAETRLQEQAKIAGSASARDGSESSAGGTAADIFEKMRRDPDYQGFLKKEARRNVLRQYADAIKALNLPPDQAAKLADLLVERQLSQQDARQAALQQGLKDGSREMSQAVGQAYKDVNSDIAALIGADGMDQLQALSMESNYKRSIDNGVAIDLSAAGMALSADQTAALAHAYAMVSNPRLNPQFRSMNLQPPDPTTGLTGRNQALVNQAAQVLTPTQLQVFTTDQVDRQKQQEIFKRYAAPNQSLAP